jgi:hypothetical protein
VIPRRRTEERPRRDRGGTDRGGTAWTEGTEEDRGGDRGGTEEGTEEGRGPRRDGLSDPS